MHVNSSISLHAPRFFQIRHISWKRIVNMPFHSTQAGAPDSTKTSGLNHDFWQLPAASGIAFPKFPKKGQPREVYANFRKFFPEVFFSIQLSSRKFHNFRLNCSNLGNSTVSRISGNFSGKFLYHLPLFPNFRKF